MKHLIDKKIDSLSSWTNQDLEAWARGTAIVRDEDLFYNVTIYELASPYVDDAYEVEKERDVQRLDLIARLIADEHVKNEKKRDLLMSLQNRLRDELVKSSPDDDANIIRMRTSARESFLRWCEILTERRDAHPAVSEFCKVAQKLLSNWEEYSFDKALALTKNDYGGEFRTYLKRLEPHFTYHSKLNKWFPTGVE
jgi:hypothetical protein